MKPNSPEIVKKTKRVLLEVTRSSVRFPRAHRYSLGASLCEDAIQAVLASENAFRLSNKSVEQLGAVSTLSDSIDRLKAHWQLAFELQCFSFNRLDEIGGLLDDVGRQCGGWKRKIEQRLMGQSPAVSGRQERARILSTYAASSEASR